MQYISRYHSPLGEIILSADECGLTGLRFDSQTTMQHSNSDSENCAITAAKEWLDIYFSGQTPDFEPTLHLTGTPFQLDVWEILRAIPYGQTTTYGAIAERIAAGRGVARMSAQAVGGAVGRNKIAIIVPCHRVIGADGSLTGYAAGLDKKIKLLEIERIKIHKR